jgi:hypothetical protein
MQAECQDIGFELHAKTVQLHLALPENAQEWPLMATSASREVGVTRSKRRCGRPRVVLAMVPRLHLLG